MCHIHKVLNFHAHGHKFHTGFLCYTILEGQESWIPKWFCSLWWQIKSSSYHDVNHVIIWDSEIFWTLQGSKPILSITPGLSSWSPTKLFLILGVCWCLYLFFFFFLSGKYWCNKNKNSTLMSLILSFLG